MSSISKQAERVYDMFEIALEKIKVGKVNLNEIMKNPFDFK